MHPHLLLLLRLILGCVWLTAGIAKVQQVRQSARAITAFGILPEHLLYAIGIVLPFIEIALGIGFITGAAVTECSIITLVLLALFSAAIVVNLIQGRQIECNCFGQFGRSRITWWSVLRNAALALTASIVFLWPSDYAALSRWLQGMDLQLSDPPLVEFVPVILLALGVAAATHIGAATLALARVVARAEDGPALGLPERAVLRRWLRYETDVSAVSRNGK